MPQVQKRKYVILFFWQHNNFVSQYWLQHPRTQHLQELHRPTLDSLVLCFENHQYESVKFIWCIESKCYLVMPDSLRCTHGGIEE